MAANAAITLERDNFFQLTLLLFRDGNQKLREFFKSQWPVVYQNKTGTLPPSLWTDIPNDATDMRNIETRPLNFKFNGQRVKFDSGDTNTWDFSLITTVLNNSTLNFVTPLTPESKAIKELKEIRNELIGHAPDAKMPTDVFNTEWPKACNALKTFGVTQNDIDQVIADVKKPVEVLLPFLNESLKVENEILDAINKLKETIIVHHQETLSAIQHGKEDVKETIRQGVETLSGPRKCCTGDLKITEEQRVLLDDRLKYFQGVVATELLDSLPCLSQEQQDKITFNERIYTPQTALKTLIDAIKTCEGGFEMFVRSLVNAGLVHVAVLLDPDCDGQVPSEDVAERRSSFVCIDGTAVDISIPVRIVDSSMRRQSRVEEQIATQFVSSNSEDCKKLRKAFNEVLPKGVYFVRTKQFGEKRTSEDGSASNERFKDSVVFVFRISQESAVDKLMRIHEDNTLRTFIKDILLKSSTTDTNGMDLELLFLKKDYLDIKKRLSQERKTEKRKLKETKIQKAAEPTPKSVIIKGPQPCCQVSDNRSTIKEVKSKRYPEANSSDDYNIPERWLHRQSGLTQLSNKIKLSQQPLLPLATIRVMANEMGIFENDSIVTMLRFFHSQGDFLWYEEISEMKDVVIVDPNWLSDQFRTLISHLPSVNGVCEGVLHHSHLPEILSNVTEEYRTGLLTLFRSVRLCFSISHDKDLFPCKLPIGWPDREMWPPFPESNENQTSLLFEFSFIPSQFFPDLIVAINKKQDSFPPNFRPLYYRYNAVYISKQQDQCHLHGGTQKQTTHACDAGREADKHLPSLHKVHMELMSHNNSLKVTIRGPHPCCQVSDIRSTIKAVTESPQYPGIAYKERLICPMCEIYRYHKPSTFDYQGTHYGFCSKGHDVGSADDILAGKVDTYVVVTSSVGQAGRVIGETLDDHFCPKLFVVLPIDLKSLSFKDRFVYSYLRNGYAVHLLCECPEQWHFLSSPGFRVGKPKEFFKTYGGRVCKVLRVISALGVPLTSAVGPHCKAGAKVALDTMNMELKTLLNDYLIIYPHLKMCLGSPDDDLKDLKSPRGLQRSVLSRCLQIDVKGQEFGPLTCTYVDKYDEWLWLCEEHNQKYTIIERQ